MAGTNTNFFDVTVDGGGKYQFGIRFRTGLAVYEEALIDGQYVSLGWNAAGYLSDVITKPAAPFVDPVKFAQPHAFQLNVDGQMLTSHWVKGEFEQSEKDGSLHTILNLHHAVRAISVRVHTMLDGSPIISRWLEIVNHQQREAAISSVCSWSGGMQSTKRWRSRLPADAALYSLGYMEDEHWGNEGRFQWLDLANATTTISGRYLRDRFRHPCFFLRNNATGEMFVGQLAWQGGYSFSFDVNCDIYGTDDHTAHLALAIGPDAPAPLRVLDREETVRTPEVHLGIVFGGLDEGVQAMHDHIRASVFNAPVARGRRAWIESGIGPELDMSESSVFHQMELAAMLGAEVFFIDAGWYTPPERESEWNVRVGDWIVDVERYPRGIGPIRERAHALGLLFGLWMEPERIGPASAVLQDHPDWVMKGYDGNHVRGNSVLLDLGNSEVADWVRNEIVRVISDYQLDFFRLDYNVGDIRSGGCTSRQGYVENNYWRYYEQVDRLFEDLRQQFPDVIFESCASGGGRTDLGMVRHFSHTWVTDWQVAPRSFSITNGMTMALPPEYVDRLIAGQSGHTAGHIDFQARLCLFGRPTLGQFNPVGSIPNPVQLARVQHMVELYKTFVRPFIHTSRIYHHTPILMGAEPRGWGVLEMMATDKSRGIVGIFRLGNPTNDNITVRLRGVSLSCQYRVTWDTTNESVEISGRDLSHAGLVIRLEGPLTSELILVEAL
ncbi:MAG: hypothetical protein C7B45_09865 [Sulfobacillus acidophilus]|uniref:Alpha-galactosidase n=1 Tax=Sulfobacillus acidophilus TaxID=53633 RepID=A0A2T2WHI3_9FIRM|nr:MAG: hypothetical protein C7B45_09865 [Sulfobacillus acidophilus]